MRHFTLDELRDKALERLLDHWVVVQEPDDAHRSLVQIIIPASCVSTLDSPLVIPTSPAEETREHLIHDVLWGQTVGNGVRRARAKVLHLVLKRRSVMVAWIVTGRNAHNIGETIQRLRRTGRDAERVESAQLILPFLDTLRSQREKPDLSGIHEEDAST